MILTRDTIAMSLGAYLARPAHVHLATTWRSSTPTLALKHAEI